MSKSGSWINNHLFTYTPYWADQQLLGLAAVNDHADLSSTINTFKARLDKFWENQDVLYNWKADISFTGSRSKVNN